MPDLIITGVPRSGTTLAVAIIDQAPDSLCLSEPDGHVDLMRQAVSAEDFVAKLSQEFDVVRRTVLDGGAVVDRRRADGAPVTDYFSDLRPGGRRENTFTIRTIRRPGLSPDFVLGVKHNALYAAILPQIVQSGRFRVVAIVRDPVDVLMSWRTVDLPVSRGRLPAGERFWPELATIGRADLDLTDKQIRICDLLLSRFAEFASQLAVVPYEVFVTDPTKLLAAAGINEAPPPKIIVRDRPGCTGGDHWRAELTERIRRLIAIGQLPGIARYYPHYGPEPRCRSADPGGTATDQQSQDLAQAERCQQ